MKGGEDVPVRIIKEPDNQFDANAIAFQCKVGTGNWIRIGYIVKEALPPQSDGRKQNHGYESCLGQIHKIMAMKVAWAKYMVAWSRSAPVFFAGIRITVKGEWHQEVVQCQSTR